MTSAIYGLTVVVGGKVVDLSNAIVGVAVAVESGDGQQIAAEIVGIAVDGLGGALIKAGIKDPNGIDLGTAIDLAAAITRIVPGLQPVSVALTVAGVAYSLYDFKRQKADAKVNENWRNAINPPRRDPLAIDLDGDGIETIGLPTAANAFSPVLFDHDANGVRTGTGWVKPDDAWLVLDRDANGLIDSGRELFGVDTMITVTEVPMGMTTPVTVTRNAASGFEALGVLDANRDKVFNAADAQFANVRLWQDANQDGVSQASELKTLASVGITSISLTPDATNLNLGNGNTVTGQAVVTRTGGATTTVASVDMNASNLNLADNPFYRSFNDSIPLTTAAQALPGMQGSGWVRDLQEAASLPNTAAAALQTQVTSFAAAATRDAQIAQVDQLLIEWARTTGRFDNRDLRPGLSTILSQTPTAITTRLTTGEPSLSLADAMSSVSFYFQDEKYYRINLSAANSAVYKLSSVRF